MTTTRETTTGEMRATEPGSGFRRLAVEEFRLTEEPYYVEIANEVEFFEHAYEQKIPVLLKGPTGAGKTRFVEYMSWRLHGRSAEGAAD